MLYEANSAVCPTCSASASVSIGGEYDRWRLTRSLGGIKTDEVFARLLLNLWENNRKFINVSRRANGGGVDNSLATKREPESIVEATSAVPPVVEVKREPPALKTDGIDASSSSSKDIANEPKRRRTSAVTPPTSPPKAESSFEVHENSNPARAVRRILSPFNVAAPKRVDSGGRSKRQTERPKKFDDFTLHRVESTKRRPSGEGPGSPVESCGGSFAAARSALASVNASGNLAAASTTKVALSSISSLSTGPPSKPSSDPVHPNSGSNADPSASRAASIASTAASTPTGSTLVFASNVTAKEANERLIQRCIRERGLSLPVKDRNCLSKSLDGAPNEEQKTEIVKNFLRQFEKVSSCEPSSTSQPDESTNDSKHAAWTLAETDAGKDKNDAAVVQDHENLIDEVLKEKEMTYRHLHYLKRAKLRALLHEVDSQPNDEPTNEAFGDDRQSRRQRRRRGIVESFLGEIISKARRLDTVIADVEGTDSLDGATRSKLKEKLKKRVLEEDDDTALKEVVKDFVSDLKSQTSYFFDADSGHGSKRRSDSFEWSRVLNDEKIIVCVDSSQPSISDSKASIPSTGSQPVVNQPQHDRLVCKQCMKTCRDGKELQWHMRSIHDEIDAQVCQKCCTVFYTLANLKSHDCDCESDESKDDEDDDDKDEEGADRRLATKRKPAQVDDTAKPQKPSPTPGICPAQLDRPAVDKSNDAEKENSPATSAYSSPRPVRLYTRPNKRKGSSQLSCPYPNCNAVLANNSSLWSHKRRHRASAASSPKAAATGRFRCSSCPYKSHSNIVLANHVARVHGGETDDGKGRERPGRSCGRKTELQPARILKRRIVKHFPVADAGVSQRARRSLQSPSRSRRRRNSKQTLPKIPTGVAVTDGSFRPVVVLECLEGDALKLDGKKDSFAFYVNVDGRKSGLDELSSVEKVHNDDEGEETEAGTDDDYEENEVSKQISEGDGEGSDTSAGETETYSDVYFDDVHEYEGEEEQTDDGEEEFENRMESPEELREKDGGRERLHSEEFNNDKTTKCDEKDLPQVLEENGDDVVFPTAFIPEGTPTDVKSNDLLDDGECVPTTVSESSPQPDVSDSEPMRASTDEGNQTHAPTSDVVTPTTSNSPDVENKLAVSDVSARLEPDQDVKAIHSSDRAVVKSCLPREDEESTSEIEKHASELTPSGLPSYNIFQTFARRKSPSDICLISTNRERALDEGRESIPAARSEVGIASIDAHVDKLPGDSCVKTTLSKDNEVVSAVGLNTQSIFPHQTSQRDTTKDDRSEQPNIPIKSVTLQQSIVEDGNLIHQPNADDIYSGSVAATTRSTASLLPVFAASSASNASTSSSTSTASTASSATSSASTFAVSTTPILSSTEEPYLAENEERLTVTKAKHSSLKVYGKSTLAKGASASITSPATTAPKTAGNQSVPIERIGSEMRQITISTSPIKKPATAVSPSTPSAPPLSAPNATEKPEYEMFPIDIAEEVCVNDQDSIADDGNRYAEGSEHSRMIASLSELNHKSLLNQLPSRDYSRDRELTRGSEQALSTVEGAGTTFAFHYESSALSKILATNCDHDYSSPGHCEIFVSVLTKDNKKIKFVIE